MAVWRCLQPRPPAARRRPAGSQVAGVCLLLPSAAMLLRYATLFALLAPSVAPGPEFDLEKFKKTYVRGKCDRTKSALACFASGQDIMQDKS